MLLKILSLAIFIVGIAQFFKNDITLLFQKEDIKRIHSTNPTTLIASHTLEILEKCADTNTQFLKNKISQDSITKFKVFYYKNLYKKTKFPIYSYAFIKPKILNLPGKWVCTEMGPKYHGAYSDAENLLRWLEKNYLPETNFEFFYLAQEPYIAIWNLKKILLDELCNLLTACPLLVSCNHPELPWTKNAVLFPDPWMLRSTFEPQLHSILISKDIGPFAKRKPIIFFRGALTGLKHPLTQKNMSANPRHHILSLLKKFPYLDFGVTNFSPLNEKTKDNAEYKQYILDNFYHLKRDSVDFIVHAKNKYLLSCDGMGAAWTRVPYILATGSVLFLNAECEQYFYQLMKNQQTHVVINQDFSNLDAEFHKLENHSKVAEKIGRQGKEFAQQFLTKAPIDAYMLLILKKLESYSNAQD